MSAKPGDGRSKDGLTRRDCVHGMSIGRGAVACDLWECLKLTGGNCVGRKLCKEFEPRKAGGAE